jgi:hypothetical protein
MMTQIVRAATLAPSPDNNQPWCFVPRGDELTVQLDRSACLPSDVDHMFDLIALGAAIENSVLAAGMQGYSTDVAYVVDERVPESPDRYCPIARLRFTDGGQESPLARWIGERATCRRPYDTEPVAKDKLSAISDAAVGNDVSLDWLEDRMAIRALSKVVAKADGLRFRYQAFHEELYRQLRFAPAEAEATRTGLDVRTFELPRPAVWALRWLHSWRRMRALHVCGLGGLLTGPSAQLVRSSAAIGILTLSNDGGRSIPSTRLPTAAEYLESGRALERAWLAATSLGLSVHPLGSLPIFMALLRRLESGAGQWGSSSVSVDRTVLQPLRDALAATLPHTVHQPLVMLFRLGRAAPPSARSLRRPIEQITASHE